MQDAPPPEPRTQSERLFRLQAGLLLVIAVILVFAALRAAEAVVVPLLISLFVTLVVVPFNARLRAHLPDRLAWLSYVASMAVLIALLGGFAAGIGLASQQVVAKFSDELAPAETETGGQAGDPGTASLREAGEALLKGGALSERMRIGIEELGRAARDKGLEYAGAILRSMIGVVTATVLVLFLCLLLLMEERRWREKIALVTSDDAQRVSEAARQAAHDLRMFLVVKAALGAATGALYAAWMMVMGLDLLLVWGFLTFLLSFIPTIGSLIAGALAAGYAFYQLGVGDAIIVAIGLLIIEQVMGNFLEPRLLGRSLSLSPFMVLIFLVFCAWLWGAVGALLATPLLIAILAVAGNFRQLQPIARLIGK